VKPKMGECLTWLREREPPRGGADILEIYRIGELRHSCSRTVEVSDMCLKAKAGRDRMYLQL